MDKAWAVVGRKWAWPTTVQTFTTTLPWTPAEVKNSHGGNVLELFFLKQVCLIKQCREGAGEVGGWLSSHGWKRVSWLVGRRTRSGRRAGRSEPGSQSSSLLSAGRTAAAVRAPLAALMGKLHCNIDTNKMERAGKAARAATRGEGWWGWGGTGGGVWRGSQRCVSRAEVTPLQPGEVGVVEQPLGLTPPPPPPPPVTPPTPIPRPPE